MKKRFIITTSALIILLFAGLGINYILSLHKITFTLQNAATGITLYTSDKKEVKQLTSSGSVSLQDGKYYLIPEGENLSKNKIPFTVEGKDKTITVNPSYSSEYLLKLADKERSAVETAITKKYPTALSEYTLTKSTLYGRGEWFGGLLAPKVSDIRDERDPYRIVLQKKDSTWEVVRRPEYILTSSRYQDVPTAILKEINSIVP